MELGKAFDGGKVQDGGQIKVVLMVVMKNIISNVPLELSPTPLVLKL